MIISGFILLLTLFFIKNRRMVKIYDLTLEEQKQFILYSETKRRSLRHCINKDMLSLMASII